MMWRATKALFIRYIQIALLLLAYELWFYAETISSIGHALRILVFSGAVVFVLVWGERIGRSLDHIRQKRGNDSQCSISRMVCIFGLFSSIISIAGFAIYFFLSGNKPPVWVYTLACVTAAGLLIGLAQKHRLTLPSESNLTSKQDAGKVNNAHVTESSGEVMKNQ